ncbi:MAG: hypothetical protein IIX92_00135 [Selenomonadales bacterium]|jgi:hypothetical protein|nr:hypothetical protein [Selenomonadales bacterium]MBQ2246891.1 hypothetical protein [Selenomonadales bacterium]MBQ5587885.1 hypothetical protein [Selenomonadales bacterium]
MQKENVKKAIEAVELLCGKCPSCTPDCPVAISLRALKGLCYELEQMDQ